MPPRERIVSAARSWIGTPYRHQASVRGAGADCLGLLRGIWREVYGREPEAPPPYTPDWAEPQHQERLWEAAGRHLIALEVARAEDGDVLLFRMREGGVAKHLGILASVGPEPAFVHAYSGHAVTESPLSAPWRRRIVAAFQFPELEV